MAALSGMKEICQHCNRSEASVLKWIRECGFPADKFGGIGWESDTEMIAEWRKEQLRKKLQSAA